MWYVVQTVGGQEKHVLDLINKLVDEELIQESFIPQYEVKKRIQGVWKMRSEVLLPGYIFVITDQPGKLREALRSVPKFTRLLGNNDVFTPLDDQEVAFINAFTKPDHRVVEFSSGVIRGRDRDSQRPADEPDGPHQEARSPQSPRVSGTRDSCSYENRQSRIRDCSKETLTNQ